MNLKYQTQQFLLTSIDTTILDIYADVNSVKKLVYKPEGFEIPGGTTATWSKQVTEPATKKIVGVKLSRQIPSANSPLTTSYDYGIRIVKKYKTPAYIDNTEYWPNGKWYGGVYPVLTIPASPGNLYADSDALAMEAEIMNLITKDTGMARPIDGAAVNARRAYIVTDDVNSDATTLLVTLADGTAVTVTASGAAAGQLGVGFNGDANVNTVLKCYWLEAVSATVDKYLITSVANDYEFTLADGTDSTVGDRYILLDSKHDDVLFDVYVDPIFGDATTTFNLIDITSSDSYAAASNMLVNVDGTSTLVTAGTNQATVLAALDKGTITGVNAISWGTKILVASISTVTSLTISFPYISGSGTPLTASNESLTFAGTRSGKFSSLTTDDVQRVFATAGHHGDLSTAVRLGQTTASTEYVKYTLTSSMTTAAIHGASHFDTSQHKVEFYIPKSLVRADLWDGTDIDSPTVLHDTPTGALDRTIDELLNVWKS